LETKTARRWAVLAAFSSVAMISQMLWLNFAPVLDLVQKKYSVDESTAGLLILVFPLLYVVLSIPAGILIDRRGYRTSVIFGAILQALFSLLRIYDSSFVALLVAQIGIAIAQPFIVNGISKLASDWFDESQGAIANGIGTMGMFIGMAVAMAATPILIEKVGFRGAMICFAVFSTLCALIYILVDPYREITAAEESARFMVILKSPPLLLMFFLAFLGLGFFNGLTTWLEAILAPNGIGSVDAGLIGAALICGGIAGSAIIPALSDRFRKRKPFVIACVLFALALTYPLAMGRDTRILLALATLLGFFFLPAFALLLEMSSELAGEAHTGAATGLLMLSGNAGGVVVIVGMQVVKGDSPTFYSGVIFLMVTLLVALVGAFFAPETYGVKPSSNHS